MIATADNYTGFVPLTPTEADRDRSAIAREVGDRYRVQHYLARGGFASVWQATDLVENLDVAIKRIDAPAARGRDFFRELRAMLLLDHPHVVRLVNFLEGESTRFLILELCRGGSLRAAISRKRRAEEVWNTETVRRLITQIARGLQAAHAAGLTHRDLKPENILFASGDVDSPVKLADFGLAGLFHDDTGRLRALTGSPAYMAPEQFGGSFQPASDMYALGVIAFELLTGELPFHGSPEELAYQHLQVPPALEAFHEPWNALLPRLLDKTAANRPTAGDVVKQLTAAPKTVRPAPSTDVAEHRFPGMANAVWATADNAWLAFEDHLESTAGQRIDVPQVQSLRSTATGQLWLQTPQKLLQWQNGTIETLADRPASLKLWQAWHDPAGPIILSAQGDTVTLTRQGQTAWTVTIPGGGLKRYAARHGDGCFAISDFEGQSGLQIRDADGALLERIPLPGMVWQVQPWSEQRRFALRVITGDGFRVFCTRTRGGLMLLPEGADAAHLACCCTGIVTATASGAVVVWDARRQPSRVPIRLSEGESIRGVAIDRTAVHVLSATAEQTILRTARRPAPGGES